MQSLPPHCSAKKERKKDYALGRGLREPASLFGIALPQAELRPSIELQIDVDTLRARVEAVDGLARLPRLVARGLHTKRSERREQTSQQWEGGLAWLPGSKLAGTARITMASEAELRRL